MQEKYSQNGRNKDTKVFSLVEDFIVVTRTSEHDLYKSMLQNRGEPL
jgi:hypothetical protein